jgi:hypothetical protein
VILHREAAPRRDGDSPALPQSVPELGRFLTRERTRQNLGIDEVSARTGLPQAMLEAFESGTVDRLPDQVQTVKALRGYADALGLEGNAYALLLIDLWPSYGGGPPVVVVQGTSLSDVSAAGAPGAVAPATAPTDGDTAMVPISAAAAATAPPPPARTTVRAAPSTVHRVGGTSDPGVAGAMPMVLADTGVTPAIPVAHRRRSPWALRVIVAVVVLALIVGIGGLALHHYKPQWLHDVGIGSGPKSHPAATTSHHTTPPAAFRLTHSTPTSATFAVRAPSFIVKVVAVGGSSWIQASDAHHVNPIFSGEVAQNSQQLFTVHSSLTLQVGSQNARVFVSQGFKPLGFYFPQDAPFTLVFNRAS